MQHSCDPAELVFEITETALVGRSIDRVAETLVRLREIGVRIALDDFGTGFSSLSHLRDFAVDKVKIDRSFICDLDGDAGDRRLVAGIVAWPPRSGSKLLQKVSRPRARWTFSRRSGAPTRRAISSRGHWPSRTRGAG